MFNISKKLILTTISINFIVLTSLAMEEEEFKKPARQVLQGDLSESKNLDEKVDPQIATLVALGSTKHPTVKKAIVWDLGDTLLFADKYKLATQKLGLKNLVSYWLLGHKNPFKINRQANVFLSMLGEQKVPKEETLRSSEGFAVSQLSVDLLSGLITPAEACAQASKLVEDLERGGSVRSPGEKAALLSLMHYNLDYPHIPDYLKIYQQAVDLVAECAQAPDCQQYVLTNWHAESFDEFHESEFGQNLFKFIPRENCMISGEQQMVKPNPALFRAFLEKYNLNPEYVLLIDDVRENVEGARKEGYEAIHFHKMSYAKLRKLLIKAGYLPAKK